MLSGTAALHAFREFISSHSSAFRRIANRADASVSLHDVQQDAWIAASEISEKRGQPVDFKNADDQEAVISWLYCKFIKFTSRRLRNAVRIDGDDDEDTPSLSLPGSDNDNPLNQIIQAESNRASPVRVPAIVHESYSQASAYAVLLAKFDGKKSTVATLLGITRSAFSQRFQRAYAWIEIQPSLFDGLIRINMDFMPSPAKLLGVVARKPINDHYSMNQILLAFDEGVVEKAV